MSSPLPRESNTLPETVGLCSDPACRAEFYMPDAKQGDLCPMDCDGRLQEFARLHVVVGERNRLREALSLIAQHARLDLTERGISEAERYAVIAEDALR